MSILGAMNTAVSGLTAQSAAFSNISDNVANSQTVGFKGVGTSFTNYLTTSSASLNDPGTVVASPQYTNSVQGTISQSTNSLALAISGQGFFDVSQPIGTTGTGTPTFASQQYYTRDGDFRLNSSGYLTNDSGQYLNGWVVDTSGVLNKSTAVPIQVSQSVYKPVATAKMAMSANLPAGLVNSVTEDANGNVKAMYDSSSNQVSAIQPQEQIYDAQGTAHTVQYSWTPQPGAVANADGSYPITANTWVLSATMDGSDLGEVTVNFNSDGTLTGIGVGTTGTGTATPGSALIGAAPTYSNTTNGTAGNGGRWNPEDHPQPRRHRRNQRRDTVFRHQLHPARAQPGRRAARQLHQHLHQHRRRHLRQLRQRPDPPDRAGAGGDLRRRRRVAVAERQLVHGD